MLKTKGHNLGAKSEELKRLRTELNVILEQEEIK